MKRVLHEVIRVYTELLAAMGQQDEEEYVDKKKI